MDDVAHANDFCVSTCVHKCVGAIGYVWYRVYACTNAQTQMNNYATSDQVHVHMHMPIHAYALAGEK